MKEGKRGAVKRPDRSYLTPEYRTCTNIVSILAKRTHNIDLSYDGTVSMHELVLADTLDVVGSNYSAAVYSTAV